MQGQHFLQMLKSFLYTTEVLFILFLISNWMLVKLLNMTAMHVKEKLNSTYSTYLPAGLKDAVQLVALLPAAVTRGSGATLLCIQKGSPANCKLLRAPGTALYLWGAVPDSRFSCQSTGSAGWHVCLETSYRLPENSAQVTCSHLLQAQNKAHRSWKITLWFQRASHQPLRKLCTRWDTRSYFRVGFMSWLNQHPEPAGADVFVPLTIWISSGSWWSQSICNPFWGTITKCSSWNVRKERTFELAATSPPCAEPTYAAFHPLTWKSDFPWPQNLLLHWALLPFHWTLPFLPVLSWVRVALAQSKRKEKGKKKSQVSAKFSNRASLHQINELQRTVIFWGTGRNETLTCCTQFSWAPLKTSAKIHNKAISKHVQRACIL